MVSGPCIRVIRSLSLVHFKIAVQFLLGTTLMVGQIFNNTPMLQQDNTSRDVDGVLEIMTTHKDSCLVLLGIVDQEFLEQYLT